MQRRFFKTSDLHDLFSLNEGTADQTESSAIFAGTNSEVKPKHGKVKRERYEREPKFVVEKPEKVKTVDKVIFGASFATSNIGDLNNENLNTNFYLFNTVGGDLKSCQKEVGLLIH